MRSTECPSGFIIYCVQKILNSVYFCMRDQFKTGERVLTTQLVEIEQEKQSSDTASAVLQDELIQAAVRERQLQMQLDKLQKELDNIKLEQEMKQRESGFRSVV